ncbi:MAG: transglutaminase family protein [Bulleidia sp.]|nr:transglutaminase family protein [Bulleidia sp.]
MRTLKFYYKTENHYTQPVTEHDFLLRCIPQELPEQRILSMKLTIEPECTGGNYGSDSFGNRTFTGRLPEEHDFFSYMIEGEALRDDTKIPVTAPLPIYSYASSMTVPSPFLRELLGTIPEDGDVLTQAWQMADTVYHHMEYVSGVTNIHTTAAQALELGQGVCQDFTHIFLAMCRMRRIPARYVSGLPEGEGASHAWGEVWYNGIWHGFDPTRDCLANESYLKLCTGRDFHDCPIEQGLFHGFTDQTQTVFTRVMDAQQ